MASKLATIRPREDHGIEIIGGTVNHTGSDMEDIAATYIARHAGLSGSVLVYPVSEPPVAHVTLVHEESQGVYVHTVALTGTHEARSLHEPHRLLEFVYTTLGNIGQIPIA